MSKPANAEKLFDDISQFVSESRALLEEGAVMELAGLDDQVKLLCEEALQLSQEDRARYATRLQKLFDELKALGEMLARHRDEMADDIRSLSDHRRASVAYRSADASDGKKKDGE